MDERLRLLFREEFHLDDMTPRAVRHRIASFAPLLGGATADVQLAATEVATAFARQREPDSSIEVRLFGVDRFRVEISNSLKADDLLATDQGGEPSMRRAILDETTDRWGVLGNGAAVVWFEVEQTETPLKEAN